MTRVIAFDVNETLLDLGALDSAFEDLFGSATVRPQWFAQMLQLSFVGGMTGEYVDFTTAQHAALSMVAERRAVASARARPPLSSPG
jgi:2-haloacid dehalogenase